jgi:hypothetical protein
MKYRSLVIAFALAVMGTLLSVQSASAATWYTGSCSTKGFRGYHGILASYLGKGKYRVYRVQYKINKGSNWGGNNADVDMYVASHNNPVYGSKHFRTTTAKQDNKWHVLREADFTIDLDTSYSGGHFVFDWSAHRDPICNS